jgi:hypothetical protein
VETAPPIRPQENRQAQLRQIQVSYVPAEDRLLVRFSTTDRKEFSLWFTRRLVSLIWPPLIEILAKTASTTATTQTPEVRQASLAFEHQTLTQQADYSQQYNNEAADWPLGKEPVLVVTTEIQTQKSGRFNFRFHPKEGKALNMSLPRPTIHSLCKLIIDATEKGEWKMNLSMGASPQPGTPTLQ